MSYGHSHGKLSLQEVGIGLIVIGFMGLISLLLADFDAVLNSISVLHLVFWIVGPIISIGVGFFILLKKKKGGGNKHDH